MCKEQHKKTVCPLVNGTDGASQERLAFDTAEEVLKYCRWSNLTFPDVWCQGRWCPACKVWHPTTHGKKIMGVVGDLESGVVYVAGDPKWTSDDELLEAAGRAERMKDEFELGSETEHVLGVNLKKCSVYRAQGLYLNKLQTYNIPEAARERYLDFLENRIVYNAKGLIDSINDDIEALQEEPDWLEQRKAMLRMINKVDDMKNSWFFSVYPEIKKRVTAIVNQVQSEKK